jgi:hypothetical protein
MSGPNLPTPLEEATVYIAGPYSSDPDRCVEAALRAYNEVLDLGLRPYLPHFSHFAHLRKPRDYEAWMKLDLAWLARCDVLVRLPGASDGADREFVRAQTLGMPVYEGVASLAAALVAELRQRLDDSRDWTTHLSQKMAAERQEYEAAAEAAEAEEAKGEGIQEVGFPPP